MKMKNIKQYNEDELSLRVFDEEYLYNQRHEEEFLDTTIPNTFDYTEKQYNVLKEDLLEDYIALVNETKTLKAKQDDYK